MPISNPEVDARYMTDGIVGYKKRRVSLKQCLARLFLRIQSSRGNVDCNRPHCSMGIRIIASQGCRGHRKLGCIESAFSCHRPDLRWHYVSNWLELVAGRTIDVLLQGYSLSPIRFISDYNDSWFYHAKRGRRETPCAAFWLCNSPYVNVSRIRSKGFSLKRTGRLDCL